MKGFDSIRAKSAVKVREPEDLSRSHQTTMDFGQIGVLMHEETVPGDKFTLKSSYFSRMAPLVKPTYGKFSFNTATFFVPYYQVADDAEAFFAGKTTFNGNTVYQRYITMQNLAGFYELGQVSTDVTSDVVAGTRTEWDYAFVNSGGTQKYRAFTATGKYWNNILTQLGFAVPQGVDWQANSAWRSDVSNYKLSAYPLLAFLKAYNDWMSNSSRYNTSPLSKALSDIRHNVNGTVIGYTNGGLGVTTLQYLLGYVRLTYETDYFTSAWRQPVNVIGTSDNLTTTSVPSIPNSSGFASEVFSSPSSDNLLRAVNGGSSLYFIGQRALDFLKDFDDWVRRNNYSGSKVVQQLYSRFGIKTEDYRSNYAHLLNTTSDPIQVGDVTQTTPTTSPLGDYAGKGIMQSNGSLQVEVNDIGMLMILGYFTVKPIYAYGFDRSVLRNAPLDYYNPEFDGLGAEAIPYMELFENGTQAAAGDSSSSVGVYGFTERYNSYRFGRDQITGEFRNFFNGNDMNVWHTGRLLNDLRRTNGMEAQADAMIYLNPTSTEYNRIFNLTGSDKNHFYMTAFFDVSAVRPMQNLNQVPRLGVGDTKIDRNGTQIS